MEDKKMILGVVSAYGTMSDADSRYRIVIRGNDESDLKGGIKYFLTKEFQRSKESEEIMEELEELDFQPWEIDNQISKAVKEGLKSLVPYDSKKEITDNDPYYNREIISLLPLLTDYHVEIFEIDKDSELSSCPEFVVMTGYDVECMGYSEFAHVERLGDPTQEPANPNLLKVLDFPICYQENVRNNFQPVGEISLEEANKIGSCRYHILDLSKANMGEGEEEYSICLGYSHYGPVIGGSGTRKVEIFKRILERVEADCIILPDDVARRHINAVIRNPKIKSIKVGEDCKLFSMVGDTLCNKKKTIEIFKPR